MWKRTDCLFSTSVRDALTLSPFEFIISNEESGKKGVVIISEFSGSSRVLSGALRINPWNRDQARRAANRSTCAVESTIIAYAEYSLRVRCNTLTSARSLGRPSWLFSVRGTLGAESPVRRTWDCTLRWCL
jgi:hypothetical protein